MEIYHVLNRGVDKRKVFLEEIDYIRFLHDMFVFNDTNYVDPNHAIRFSSDRFISSNNLKRELLVKIHAFCLMPNHYHMLLSEVSEGGISQFMKKINKGYSQYFNEKNKRSGALWQGKYKKILIEKDAHFIYIPYYIHLNPLDLTMPQWRKGNITNTKEALKHLRKYKWSSHLDYLGEKNFPSIISKSFLENILGDSRQYEKEITNIIAGDKNEVALESTIIE